MKIKRLVIENYKSIERIELIEPNPFTVFVGPNGSGKSNIFEALEFVNRYSKTIPDEVIREFGGIKTFRPRQQSINNRFEFEAELDNIKPRITIPMVNETPTFTTTNDIIEYIYGHQTENSKTPEYQQFFRRFSRLFINQRQQLRLNYQDDIRLNLAASNLEPVLRRVLANDTLRTEIFEWLELFVPSFKAVEVDDRNELHWFEENVPDYFTKNLISDGTYNILALLAAVYQSDDKPQFLCIEEPENGLHPQVARELIDFFRLMCEERGHYIWLNTHSQSMVSRVRPEELVIVEKKQGATQVRQFKKEDFYGMRVDDAWLTNSLGGGLAW